MYDVPEELNGTSEQNESQQNEEYVDLGQPGGGRSMLYDRSI